MVEVDKRVIRVIADLGRVQRVDDGRECARHQEGDDGNPIACKAEKCENH